MPTPHQVELKSHALVARLTCTWCKMESEEEHGSGRRKVHAFMQDSTALVWDTQGRWWWWGVDTCRGKGVTLRDSDMDRRGTSERKVAYHGKFDRSTALPTETKRTAGLASQTDARRNNTIVGVGYGPIQLMTSKNY